MRLCALRPQRLIQPYVDSGWILGCWLLYLYGVILKISDLIRK